MSLMRSHQKKAFAKKQKTSVAQTDVSLHKAEYRKWKKIMEADRRDLYAIPEHDERNLRAAEVVNKYIDYLSEWLESGVEHQNDVLVQCCIWAADGQCWDLLFPWADAAIANPKLGVLHWFKRSLADTLAETMIKFASDELKNEKPITVPVEWVAERLLTKQWPITTSEGNDNYVMKARYGRIAGIKAEAAEDWENAVRFFTWATEVKPDIGVKGRLDTAIKKLAEQTQAEETADDNDFSPEADANVETTADATDDTGSPSDKQPPTGQTDASA